MDVMVLSDTVDLLLSGCMESAQQLVHDKLPFTPHSIKNRNYSEKEKMQVFLHDGFIDRYSGKRLVNPGDRRKFCVIDEPRQYENLRLSQE